MRILTPILSCLLALDIFACRFNVRDVGFVDLDSEKYRLFIYVPETISAAESNTLKSIAYATFLDSNIDSKVIENGSATKGMAAEFRPRELDEAQAVLISADGKSSLTFSLAAKGKPLAISAWDALESVFDSPRRNTVLSKIYEHYGVILIIEGKDADENVRIRKMADTVVETITAKMDGLEKEIREPPVVEVISAAQFDSERTFLWSLGVTAIAETPQVAVLYGRGRIIGPVLSEASLDERSLTAIVNTIGLNCECGLDRKWMQGTMIPQKWDEDVQKRFADHLGFDPESPAIRLEMSQILAKGGKGQGPNTPIGGTLDDLLLGYREGVLNNGGTEKVEPEKSEPTAPGKPEAEAPKPPQTPPRRGFSFLGWMMMAGVPILVAGGVILFLDRKRDS